MNVSDKWLKKLDNLRLELSSRYVTKQQFEHELRSLLAESQCPLVGLFYDVVSEPPYQNIQIGSRESGGSEMRAYSPEDNRGTRCEIHQWWKHDVKERPSRILALFEKLFESFWKSDLRTESAGYFDLKREKKAAELADATIEYEANRGDSVVVLNCDLDNFKAVNTKFGMGGGDRVIREFGACLESFCIENAILFHHGGDEFALLMPTASPEDGLVLAYGLCKEVSGYDFKTEDLPIGVSVGISHDIYGQKGFNDLKADAEIGLKEVKSQGDGGKGNARFGSQVALKVDQHNLDFKIKLGHCISKVGINSAAPFSNVWINTISRVTKSAIDKYGIDSAYVEQYIVDFLNWSRFQFAPLSDSRSWRVRDKDIDYSAALSALDICFAIIHGSWGALITQSSLGNKFLSAKIIYDEDSNNASLSIDDGDIFWESEKTKEQATTYDLGEMWRYSDGVELSAVNTSPSILIHIGNDECGLPKLIFSDQIIVDDRPARGGGLPDFWEAAIARLISQLLSNNNITNVYLLGNHEYAKSVYSKLRSVESWGDDVEQMAYKTGAKVSEINNAVVRLNGNVHFPKNEEELLDLLTEEIRHKREIQYNEKLSRSEGRAPFLRKSVSLDDFLLTSKDGCNVNTVAEAFPVALDIVRLCHDAQTSYDQAGKVMKELRCFKIHLSTPLQDMVPSFYRKEKDSLDDYFQKEFVDEDGLFSKELKKDDQFNYVINEIANIIETSHERIATRRAILIIPHNLKPRLAPLGLVSVQIMPRFVENIVKIHFSYSWRTVEALVGLPYSLYASVKYSEYLQEQIAKKLSINKSNLVEIGDVTYIAGSLHMFLDDYGQGIARRIVNEVSY